MDSILEGDDPGLTLVDPRDRICPDGTPGWHWEVAPKMETSTGETLIQLTGGAYDSGIGGVTNSYRPNEKLHFGILKPGEIYRTEFRVKRNGVYQRMDKSAPDDFIQVGDVLEFYGPSSPDKRQLFLKHEFPLGISDGLFELTREPTDVSRFGQQPPVELRVESLGFSEIAKPYSEKEEEEDEFPEELFLENNPSEPQKQEQKKRYDPCGIGRICKAAAKGLSRLLGGRRRQGPTIEIPPLNMDDRPVDGSDGPFSSHRRFQPEYLSAPKDTSILYQGGEDEDFLGDDLFEPRVRVPKPERVSIFKPTRVRPGDIYIMDQILEQIDENPAREDFGRLYTLGGGGDAGETAPANDISSEGADEDIPNELLVPPARLYTGESFDQIHTPDFRGRERLFADEDEDSGEQLAPQGQGGDDESVLFETTPVADRYPLPIEIQPGMDMAIELGNFDRATHALIDTEWSNYAECVQNLLTFDKSDGVSDDEVQFLVDKTRGVYTILDFYRAAEENRPFPPCPRVRQDIINLAIDQGYERYVAPGATGANPQSGVGAGGM
ncbi:hypothetical protein TWF718_003508 [Orbilia javanica]|uniref:Uncharacterized protein n=1 Tax=Orbilia javanica TaxID=47235 RepID=A0AAN8MLB2_9PEZI